MMNRNSSYVPQSTSLFSAILSKSKLEAIRLREDANQMKDITRNNAAWDSHAAYSAIIADDIDTMIDKINQATRLAVQILRGSRPRSIKSNL